MPSHIHQSKRHIRNPPSSSSQPQITNYFTPSTDTAPTTSTSTPPLPHPIQSSLLSVGMRIRKSVPEGYKTGCAYSAFDLFTDNTPTSTSVSASEGQKYKGTGMGIGMRPRSGKRELAPFCGLNKIGGMGVQDEGVEYESIDVEGEDWYVGSQESGVSVGKRRFDDEEEGEEEGDFNEGALMDVGLGGRRIAVPKTRKIGKDGLGGAGMRMRIGLGGDENADMDFGEADFLDYGLAEEIQMGGV